MCTTFTLKTKANTVVACRAMDFGVDIIPILYIIPRDYDILPESQHIDLDIFRWKGKYGYVSIGVENIEEFISGSIGEIPPELNPMLKYLEVICTDGVNEHGLSVGFLDMETVKYPIADEDKDFVLLPLFLCNWLLSNCKDIKDVKVKLSNLNIGWPSFLGSLSNSFTLYVAVSDKTGKSITIEYQNGDLIIYDNPVGVTTNAPSLPWHLENLRNYPFLNSQRYEPYSIDEYNIVGHNGSGMMTVPAATSSISRFVMVSYIKRFSPEYESTEEAFQSATHILNSIDHPDGMIVLDAGPDLTRWAVVKELNEGVISIRTRHNMSYNSLDYSNIDFSTIDAKRLALLNLPVKNSIEL